MSDPPARRRRGRGEGSIYQRSDGRWEGRVTLGWSPGGRDVRSVYGATQAEVIGKLAKARQQVAAGLPTAPERLTVAKFMGDWVTTAEARLRPSTAMRYHQLVERQIVPTWGRCRLNKLSPQDVNAGLAALQQVGLSPRTCNHVRAVLRAALNDAQRWGLLGRNAAALATPPRVPEPAPVVLKPEEAMRLVESLQGQLRLLALVALYTGLRQGELLGLRWSDVDLDQQQLHVRTSLGMQAGEYRLSEPKSASSRRTVPISDRPVEALRAEQAAQAEARLAAGRNWHEPIPGLVWTTATGQPRNGPTLTHQFEKALQQAGLSVIRWHDLRAAHGALLLQAGIDLAVVSRELGHSAVGVTARHYAGVSDSLGRQAAQRLAALLGQAEGR